MRARPASASRRRTLKRGLAALLALPFAAALVSMLGSVRRSQQPAAFPIPGDVPVGLSIVEGVIVHRQRRRLGAGLGRALHAPGLPASTASSTTWSSVRATARASAATARVAAGPATRALTPLAREPDASTGGWMVGPLSPARVPRLVTFRSRARFGDARGRLPAGARRASRWRCRSTCRADGSLSTPCSSTRRDWSAATCTTGRRRP